MVIDTVKKNIDIFTVVFSLSTSFVLYVPTEAIVYFVDYIFYINTRTDLWQMGTIKQ
jgi:hypothetical protein